MQGVNYGVASNSNLLFTHILMEQVLSAESCRSEVVSGNASGNLTIHLFRPRTIDVVGAKSSFNMCHWYLLIESSQSGSSAGGRITMDKNNVRFRLYQHIFHTQQYTSCDVVKILSLLHDV